MDGTNTVCITMLAEEENLFANSEADLDLARWAAESLPDLEMADLVKDATSCPAVFSAASGGLAAAAGRLRAIADVLDAAGRRMAMARGLVDAPPFRAHGPEVAR